MNLSDHRCSIRTVIIDPHGIKANDDSSIRCKDNLISLLTYLKKSRKFTYNASVVMDEFSWSEFGISSWRGSRVDGRLYLQSGAIDGSEANRIIHDSKLEFENSRFTYLRGVRVAREDDRGVNEGREDVREVFQQRGSGAKRKLSRCGRNQMGNEPILALPEGANDFVVLKKDCMTNVCGVRFSNWWSSMKKNIASCGSKYLAYSRVEVEYQGSSGLLLQPELSE
ncbi:hypothetical protein Tco_0673023 [Tanacetum coccineum]